MFRVITVTNKFEPTSRAHLTDKVEGGEEEEEEEGPCISALLLILLWPGRVGCYSARIKTKS